MRGVLAKEVSSVTVGKPKFPQPIYHIVESRSFGKRWTALRGWAREMRLKGRTVTHIIPETP